MRGAGGGASSMPQQLAVNSIAIALDRRWMPLRGRRGKSALLLMSLAVRAAYAPETVRVTERRRILGCRLRVARSSFSS